MKTLIMGMLLVTGMVTGAQEIKWQEYRIDTIRKVEDVREAGIVTERLYLMSDGRGGVDSIFIPLTVKLKKYNIGDTMICRNQMIPLDGWSRWRETEEIIVYDREKTPGIVRKILGVWHYTGLGWYWFYQISMGDGSYDALCIPQSDDNRRYAVGDTIGHIGREQFDEETVSKKNVGNIPSLYRRIKGPVTVIGSETKFQYCLGPNPFRRMRGLIVYAYQKSENFVCYGVLSDSLVNGSQIVESIFEEGQIGTRQLAIGDTMGYSVGRGPFFTGRRKNVVVHVLTEVREGAIIDGVRYLITVENKEKNEGELIIDTVIISTRGLVRTYTVGDTVGYSPRGPMVVWFPDLPRKIRNSPKGIVKKVLFDVKDFDDVKMMCYITNSGKEKDDTCFWGIYSYLAYVKSYAVGDTIESLNRHGPWLIGYPWVITKVFGGWRSEKYLFNSGLPGERDPEIIHVRDGPLSLRLEPRYAVGDTIGGIRRGMRRVDSGGMPLYLSDNGEEDNAEDDD